MIKRVMKKLATQAIDNKIAVVQQMLEMAIERDRPYHHLQHLRGAIEGLEMARDAVATCDLPTVPKAA